MAEDHQPTMTLSDTFCDLCPPQKLSFVLVLSKKIEMSWEGV